jgi:hypothetical protein
VPWEVACDRNWLGVEKSTSIAEEKSAEGIVPCSSKGEARTVSRGGLKEGSGYPEMRRGNAPVGQKVAFMG